MMDDFPEMKLSVYEIFRFMHVWPAVPMTSLVPVRTAVTSFDLKIPLYLWFKYYLSSDKEKLFPAGFAQFVIDDYNYFLYVSVNSSLGVVL